jgi:hypothetical protein
VNRGESSSCAFVGFSILAFVAVCILDFRNFDQRLVSRIIISLLLIRLVKEVYPYLCFDHV